ncbi:MAG: MCP four helix bundle domain-containing protein, partial [Sulfurimonadaceae bacterium]
MIRFDSLTSKGKLLLLFISIAIGLFSVSVMSVLNINATKKNLDTIYFGSLVPVMELNEILQIYHSGIASSAYKVKTEQITPDEGAMLIEEGVRKIDEIWQTYRSHFKRDDEMLYVDYTSLEIENTNGYFQALINTSMGYSDVVSVSINEIDESISHIHGVIQKLIRYETDIARYERKKFL